MSLGEGATSEGEFWESLNTACRLHLPVVYLVEDNGWAISVRASDQAPAPISELVQGFRGLAIYKVDGTDYFACRASLRSDGSRARRRGPVPDPCEGDPALLALLPGHPVEVPVCRRASGGGDPRPHPPPRT